MQKKVKHYILFLFLFTSLTVFSQITGEFFGKKDDFKKLAKRPLIVETLVENVDVIKKLNQKENHTKLVDNYKKFIKKYNELIQITVHKYWKFNLMIEYKTEVEVAELKKTKSDKYAVLSFVELCENEAEVFEQNGYTIPALKYSKIEAPIEKPDYKIYLPSTYIRADRKYLEADFKVALLAMQENIKYVMKNNESIEFQDFILEAADKNCTKLKRFTVLIEKSMLHKDLNEAKAKSLCSTNIEWVGQEEIENHMFNKTKNKAALFAVPFTVLKGGHANHAMSSVVFLKIVVDCETGLILWTNDLGNITYDKNPSQFMTERDFKSLVPCTAN